MISITVLQRQKHQEHQCTWAKGSARPHFTYKNFIELEITKPIFTMFSYPLRPTQRTFQHSQLVTSTIWATYYQITKRNMKKWWNLSFCKDGYITFFLHRTSWHHNTSKGFKRTYWEGHIRIRKVRMCVFNPLATFSDKPFVVGRQCSVTWRLLSSSNTLTFKTTWDSVVEAPWRHCKNAMQRYDMAGYTCLFIYIILYREVHQSKSTLKLWTAESCIAIERDFSCA